MGERKNQIQVRSRLDPSIESARTPREWSPSMTKQAEMAGCDINYIMKRYEEHGILPGLIKENPQFGDFSDPLTYKESLDLVQFAQDQFMALHASVRARFDNDPAKFLEFADNAANAEEMAAMGLMKPEAVERVAAQKEKAKKREAAPLEPKAKKDEGTES